MAGTVTFQGIGSGIDTQALIDGLVGVERTNQNAMKTKVTGTQSTLSNLSSVSSLLSKLKSATDALDTTAEVGSYKATSSSTGVVASANGLALPGSYSLTVEKLAREQRTYSNDLGSSSSAALGKTGTLKLGVGSGDTKDISVSATDSVDDVIGKINAAGLRVSASGFFDGTNYKIQLRGLDTGSANALSIVENGTGFGLDDSANTVQAAENARIKVDGFTVTSGTNQVTGAIRGVTLALTAESPDPVKVSVDSDSQSLQTKLQAMVDAYNGVVNKVHTLAGTGTLTASDSNLAGDSTLRSLGQRMARSLTTPVGNGANATLASIGLNLTRDGRLVLDSGKLQTALQSDAAGVAKVLAGSDATGGVMNTVSSTIDAFTRADTGLLTQRSTTFTNRVTELNKRIDREETRINRYSDQLSKQFTQMDSAVAGYNSWSSYLSQIS